MRSRFPELLLIVLFASSMFYPSANSLTVSGSKGNDTPKPLDSVHTSNFTLDVDGTDVLFMRYDVEQIIDDYYPYLWDNEKVINFTERYSEDLAYITHIPPNRRVSIVVLNETFFSSLIVEYEFENATITGVISTIELGHGTEIASLKSSLRAAMEINRTLNLNITSWRAPFLTATPVSAFLWSYQYTNMSFALGGVNAELYKHDQASSLLNNTHWELHTWANITTGVENHPLDLPGGRTTLPHKILISVTQDGEVIQVLREVPPGGSGGINPFFPIAAGILVIGLIAVVILWMKRRQ
ncbi:MAG: hypothetical protein ACOC38_11605 [Promethearchaeia archaeon]